MAAPRTITSSAVTAETRSTASRATTPSTPASATRCSSSSTPRTGAPASTRSPSPPGRRAAAVSMIDNRPDRDFAVDTDGSSESMDAMQVLIGTPNDDEMVGSLRVRGADRWPGRRHPVWRPRHRHGRLLVEHPAGARHPGRRHADRPRPRDPAASRSFRRERRGAAAAVLQGPPRVPADDIPRTGFRSRRGTGTARPTTGRSTPSPASPPTTTAWVRTSRTSSAATPTTS